MEVEPWMKIQLKTPDKTRVCTMAALLKKDPDLILGKLVRWWCWLDLHTTDEHTSMLPESVDALLRCKGFTKAMQKVGWAVLADDGTVDVVHWGEHNGKGAKKRAQDALRQSNYRNGKAAHESQSCHAGSVTDCGQVRDLEKEKENNKMVVGKATLDSAAASDDSAGATPAPPPRSIETSVAFLDWLRAIGPAHPSLRQSRALAPDVMEGALAAFKRCPQAAEYGELLTAYFGDRLHEDRHGNAFYRPTGQRKFFENLEDVISHAERWDKEAGWSRKRDKKQKAAMERQKADSRSFLSEGEQVRRAEQERAEWDDLRRELGLPPLKGGEHEQD